MFGNLIESNSHKGDYARKGSFFLGTLTIYALAFLAIGVGSIYAYSTRVENPDLRLVTLVTPTDPMEVQAPVRDISRPSTGAAGNSQPVVVSKIPVIASTDPTFVNANTPVAPKGPELPPGTNYRIGNPGDNPFVGTGGNGNGPGRAGSGGTSSGMDELGKDTPPPAMTVEKKPVPTIKKSAGPLNGQATYLPKPIYTQIAKAAHAFGVVTVQLLIDESGKVISARALNGHPLLLVESVKAAYQARFTPTTLSGVPVKVSGVITYNFVLQ